MREAARIAVLEARVRRLGCAVWAVLGLVRFLLAIAVFAVALVAGIEGMRRVRA